MIKLTGYKDHLSNFTLYAVSGAEHGSWRQKNTTGNENMNERDLAVEGDNRP